MRRPWHILVLGVLLPGVLLLGAGAACGRSAKDSGIPSAGGHVAPSASGGPSASLDPQERGRKFAQCMRDNGIDLPDPDPNGGGFREGLRDRNIDRAKLEKAIEACRALAPGGGQGAQLTPEQLEKLREWAVCMREHGVDVPDPDPNAGGLGINPGRFDTSDPKWQAAFEACRDKFIRPGPGGTGGNR